MILYDIDILRIFITTYISYKMLLICAISIPNQSIKMLINDPITNVKFKIIMHEKKKPNLNRAIISEQGLDRIDIHNILTTR